MYKLLKYQTPFIMFSNKHHHMKQISLSITQSQIGCRHILWKIVDIELFFSFYHRSVSVAHPTFDSTEIV